MACCEINKEVVNKDCLTSLFPELFGISDIYFKSMFMKSHIYVDPHACPSGWSHEQHKLAVMLAIAHLFYQTSEGQRVIVKNGFNLEDFAGKGNITMAAEGSVSIMRKVYSPANATENALMNTVYGEQLLALYEAINPPQTEIECAPYYPVGY